MNVIKDIPYVSGSHLQKHTLDLVIPSNAAGESPLFVFVHGGAWKTNDKANFTWIGERLAILFNYPVAIVNYRLSLPEDGDERVKFPAHANDLESALLFLTESKIIKEILKYQTKLKLILMGHSCGAHLISVVAFESSVLLNNTIGIIGIEGIYDIPLMDRTHPTYRKWFIENAMGEDETFWKTSSPIHMIPKAHNFTTMPYLLIHSMSDELLDPNQTIGFFHYLTKHLHAANVVIDTNTLRGTHDDVLKEEALYTIISDFVKSLSK